MSRVAVSVLEPDLDARIDERFGRATHFLFVDTDTLATEAVDNHTNRNALQGAGIASAELVSDHEADAVITGHLGPKALAALDAAGIPGFGATGMSARDAVGAFSEGRLERLRGES